MSENNHIQTWGTSMAISRTKIFVSKRGQTVRLPKAVQFPESVREVEIVVVGLKRIITPAGKAWDEWFDAPGVSDDFMSTREQPAEVQRENF